MSPRGGIPKYMGSGVSFAEMVEPQLAGRGKFDLLFWLIPRREPQGSADWRGRMGKTVSSTPLHPPSALAAVTSSRPQPHLQQPYTLARQFASLDQISGSPAAGAS
jgi:alkanesulfonate monooxygenase SsuD/methylene tetrahydromethanopterin reductase-like flavin-dependent oxidoreductase (luciferase family)